MSPSLNLAAIFCIIEQRRLAANSANAAVAAAQAQLNDLLVRQRRLVIRAPRSGRILERTVRPGDTSSAGSIMFTMARDGLVELHAEVPEAAMPDIAVGDPATVALASGRSEEHTSELQSIMRISYAGFCLQKNKRRHLKR